ncbi:response regulator transcription factor [Aquidulcibacter sp.]|jgi:DNA-binding response OmpR family regulator|uniref:response regulator transcription factor n=1 Tax=Aquidulcibacter sp. TaxID=2052990 RepID=UPI00078EAD4B|nr:response regulator [Aquidulcibacter sp.]AMS30484.1 transcriptional regulator [Hyphomonadaceae bacterium UKL13-1]MCA3695962.1 response regulator [Aquidulcibacter sp.]OYU51744.1 MAG: DNA-binding response regulator [Alphaproteobacteria bacterium PA1]HCP64272.1 DNA-binding response regulator [Hyphomonadaceae bacterium]
MSRKRTLLLVDDDHDLRTTLAEQFELTGEFDTVMAQDAASGVAAARTKGPDLVLLDIDLPDLDGREACKAIRTGGFAGPIIMLTGQSTDSDTVLGLDAGANDYVTKPFRFAVLLARVRAHLRSHDQTDVATLKIGPYDFKPANRTLTDASGKRIRLTDKEAAILRYLYRSGAKAVPRDELLREVWGYNAAVTTHTLETHIYRLRQKIEPVSSRNGLLITEGGGYRLEP